MAETHLTELEKANRTEVQWHGYDTVLCLINQQEFDRPHQKYLKLRDVMALQEYDRLLRAL